jgi:hypothetical protein
LPPRAKKAVTPEVDPFAPEQGSVHDEDEAQADTSSWNVLGNETEVNVTETKTEAKRVEDQFTGDRLSVTIKQHKGYEAGWIVLKGDTPADVLRTMQDPDFKTLMDWTKKASETFQEGSAPASGGGNPSQGGSGAQNGSQGRTQGKPDSATDGPLGPQYCNHGKKKFWSKFDDQKNQMVQIYFCPADKNDPNKCKAQYVN